MFAKLKANRAFLRKVRTSACVTNQDEHDNVHCSVCLEVKRERERERDNVDVDVDATGLLNVSVRWVDGRLTRSNATINIFSSIFFFIVRNLSLIRAKEYSLNKAVQMEFFCSEKLLLFFARMAVGFFKFR